MLGRPPAALGRGAVSLWELVVEGVGPVVAGVGLAEVDVMLARVRVGPFPAVVDGLRPGVLVVVLWVRVAGWGAVVRLALVWEQG